MMYDKRKRKNTPDPDPFEFVTGYSMEECVERLERGPTRTLDHRLNVRVDGSRFVVEAEGSPQGRLIVTADLRGSLHSLQTGTRVVARFENKNSLPQQEPFVLIIGLLAPPLVVLLSILAVGAADTDLVVKSFFYAFVAGVILAAVIFLSSDSTIRAFNKHVPDLKRWLRDHLYTPPRETDI